MHRRHLTTDQKAIIAQEILPILEEEARRRQIELGRSHGSSGTAPHTEKIPQGGEAREISIQLSDGEKEKIRKESHQFSPTSSHP